MKKILVLCTGNSCRSQMAEGYLKHFAKGKAEIYSAGIETHGVNPYAIKVMKEDKIDISSQTSNSMNDYLDIDFDFIITVCNHAHEYCPNFPGKSIKIHQDFPDPAKVDGSEDEVKSEFRRVREMIKSFCFSFASDLLLKES